MRGLDYYICTVLEVQVDNGMGAQNAIGGGGRYDKLAEEGGPSHAGSGLRARPRALRAGPEAAGVEFLRPRSATCSWPAYDDSVAPGPSRSGYRNVATPASRPRWITRSAR